MASTFVESTVVTLHLPMAPSEEAEANVISRSSSMMGCQQTATCPSPCPLTLIKR